LTEEYLTVTNTLAYYAKALITSTLSWDTYTCLSEKIFCQKRFSSTPEAQVWELGYSLPEWSTV
jgi:hypothetical protein